MVKNSSLAVLGAGSWGTALALLAAESVEEVRLWAHRAEHVQQMQSMRENARYLPGVVFPKHLSVTSDLKQCLSGIQDVLVVVPSSVFRRTLMAMKPYFSPQGRLVWGTKGIDPMSREPLNHVVEEVLGQHVPQAILSGPSFAKEVAEKRPTAVTLAYTNESWADTLLEYFMQPFFRVYKNPDMIGVELCGVLKNVLAIAVGIADGLALGANARAALMTRGLSEMGRFCLARGGRLETLLGLSGVGDLILTCTDHQSRNRRLGLAIGQGATLSEAKEKIGQAVEGADNAFLVYQMAIEHGIQLPITEQVVQILSEEVSPREAVTRLMTRSPAEGEGFLVG